MKFIFKLYLLVIIISLSSCTNKGDKFIGTWTIPQYNDSRHTNLIIITSTGNGNYLVDRRESFSDGLMVNNDGTFKEVATLNGENLEIKSAFGTLTLSIINNHLLYDSKEFIKQ